MRTSIFDQREMKGGKGSGFYGHAGRDEENLVGGSLPENAYKYYLDDSAYQEWLDKYHYNATQGAAVYNYTDGWYARVNNKLRGVGKFSPHPDKDKVVKDIVSGLDSVLKIEIASLLRTWLSIEVRNCLKNLLIYLKKQRQDLGINLQTAVFALRVRGKGWRKSS